MKLLYCFERDAASPSTQSGRPYSILTRLAPRVDLSLLSPIPVPARVLVRRYAGSPGLAWAKLRGRSLAGYAYSGRLRHLARRIEARIGEDRPDVVFAPGFTTAAYVDSAIPIVFCNDATFGGLVDYYDCHTGMASAAVRDGMRSNTTALARAAMAVYPSEWAAQSAVRLHGADPARLAVIPWGANLAPADRDIALAAVGARDRLCPRLLFVGKEWRRKGGPLALAACAELRRQGIAATLDVVGLPAGFARLPDWCTCHGVLDLGSGAQRARLVELFLGATLLFVPSRAEAFGMSFCEAAAFALPVVSTATGGIPSIVRHGVTGLLLAPEDGAAAYAATMGRLLSDPVGYAVMSRTARHEYESRLNWDVFTTRLLDVLADVAG